MKDIILTTVDWMEVTISQPYEIRLGGHIAFRGIEYVIVHEDDPARDGRFIIEGTSIGYKVVRSAAFDEFSDPLEDAGVGHSGPQPIPRKQSDDDADQVREDWRAKYDDQAPTVAIRNGRIEITSPFVPTTDDVTVIMEIRYEPKDVSDELS